MSTPVWVIRTGTANLASVLAGLRRAGAEPCVTTDPDEVRTATRLVLPGVGAFGAAMRHLHEASLVDVLREHVLARKPFLAICLGLQLLGTESEESPGVSGLAVVDRSVTRFPAGLVVPQLGWNIVEPEGPCTLIRHGYAYYANSFRMAQPPSGWNVAMSVHGTPFVASIERGAQLACQFHPELSGAFGRSLLERWIAAGKGGGSAC